MGDRFNRQADTAPIDDLLGVTLVGAGHLGSRIVESLTETGFGQKSPIIVYEPDSVEEHNVPASWFTMDQIGMNKGEAVAANAANFSGAELTIIPRKFDKQPVATPILIMSVDSLAKRKAIYDAIKGKDKPYPEYIIDVRSGWATIMLFAFHRGDAHKFFLPSMEREVRELPCSAKSVAFNALVGAGWVAAVARNMSMGKPFPHELSLDHDVWTMDIEIDYSLFDMSRAMAKEGEHGAEEDQTTST